jgi:lysophospholipase
MHALIQDLHHYHKPILTFGHSMGGLVTFLYGLKYPATVKGQIFSAPALGMPTGCKELPPFLLENLANWFKEGRVPRWGEVLATRNTTYLEAFKNDTLVNDSATFRFLDQFLRVGLNYVQDHLKNYNLPCLFLLGEKDYVIPIKRNQEIIAQLPPDKVSVHIYPDCMHDLFHDMPNEVSHIIDDMLVWTTTLLQSHNLSIHEKVPYLI